jgi:1-deoxy-D-xylulose-5-phosphate reductoisomerase
MSQTGIAVLGSTGSVGTQTLSVIEQLGDRFRVISLTAGTNTALLAEQVRIFNPEIVVAKTGAPVAGRKPLLAPAGLVDAATHPDVDIVVVAMSGHDAIDATCKAIEAGKTIALANKETIICAGDYIIPLAKAHGVQIRTMDSEHSAIWQSIGNSDPTSIVRLILTASGGPFRSATTEELANVTLAQAMSHPTYHMGAKITIDSATMMNKGLEIIEAHHLFDVEYDKIEVIIHPQSIIHSMVEFADFSTIAQLSPPDMRLPIQYALTFPDHLSSPCQQLDLAAISSLTFETPDEVRFPALGIARESGIAGGTYPTVLSAADEVAVAAFSEGRIGFLDIVHIVEETLQAHESDTVTGLEVMAHADAWARHMAQQLVQRKG